jgi:TolB-like protein/DNA-binding winged helix-turn-helix (wHTH) protein
MDAGTADGVFLFGGFRLDRCRGGLFRVAADGALAPVAMGSRALDLLQLLVERQGEVVSRDEIMVAVWRGTAVEDCNLSTQIAALRRVLDAHRPGPSCIQTVVGRGYRFAGEVIRANPPGPPIPRRHKATGLRLWWGLYGAFAILVVLIAGILAAGWNRHGLGAAQQPLSIAVLRFANLSNDPAQQFLADGITSDLRTELSQLPGVVVISRGAPLAPPGDTPARPPIRRELGVRYLLRGSVHRLGERVRINARLIDASTGAEIWAQLFDRKATDLFTVEDEVTRQITTALHDKMIVAVAAPPAANRDAFNHFLRGLAAQLGSDSHETYATATAVF